METKHTPGPWAYSKHSADFPGLFDVFVPGGAIIGSPVLTESNARLIAAAPELLDDHSDMLEFIRGYAATADRDDPVHELLKRYEATNAKATGKA